MEAFSLHTWERGKEKEECRDPWSRETRDSPAGEDSVRERARKRAQRREDWEFNSRCQKTSSGETNGGRDLPDNEEQE